MKRQLRPLLVIFLAWVFVVLAETIIVGQATPRIVDGKVVGRGATGGNVGISRSDIPQAGKKPVASEELVLSVRDSMPLAAAAELLQVRLGVPIAYEDAPWVYDGDTMRAVDNPTVQFPERIPPNTFASALGSLEIKLAVDPNTKVPTEDFSVVLQRVLNDTVVQHQNRGNPGVFHVVDMSEMGFAIVPTQVRNKKGILTPTSSPLDVRISFPEEERTATETINLIVNKVSKGSGVEIVFGGRLPQDQVIRIGSKGEIARDILARALRDMHHASPRGISPIPKRSWRLIYILKYHNYSLSLEPVRQEHFVGLGTGKFGQINWPADQYLK